MAFEVGVADFIILELSLQQNIVFSPIGEKKGHFRCFSLRSLDLTNVLDDLIERCDSGSSSNQVDVVILSDSVTVVQLSDPDDAQTKVVESTIGHGHSDLVVELHGEDVARHVALFVCFDQKLEFVADDVSSGDGGVLSLAHFAIDLGAKWLQKYWRVMCSPISRNFLFQPLGKLRVKTLVS